MNLEKANWQKNSWEISSLDLQLIDLAFAEDLGSPYQDITTNLLFSEITGIFQAKIISKNPQPIVICGLPLVKAVLTKLADGCELQTDYLDGQILAPNATLLTLTGSAHNLLLIERIILNFLQRLCAVATLTAKFVELVKHTNTKILDTRKTLPGFRHLEKYAVQCGGGVNHRMGLYDAIMIKDTHIDCLGGIKTALNTLPDNITQKFPVIIEVRSIDELSVILEHAPHKATRVLLDNMSPALMSECVNLCKGKLATEASGNISLDNIAIIAECGVDFASIGKLTHSAGSVDLSMKCDI